MKNSINDTIPIMGAPKPEFPSISKRTHDYIRMQINKLLDSNYGEWDDSLRKAAHALNLFPLSPANGNRWYGVRPDGDLLSFELREPYNEQEEEDQWKRAAVLMQASDRYPELQPLVPPPPLSCYTCPRCGGAGVIQRKGEAILCICEGLGWLPSIEDEIGDRKEDQDTGKTTM
ncbi:MAG: hypothetical protein ICV53_21920 [Flavisolibacter sp.]|nr:hypothetical protein [Flavisolibacter sp.]